MEWDGGRQRAALHLPYRISLPPPAYSTPSPTHSRLHSLRRSSQLRHRPPIHGSHKVGPAVKMGDEEPEKPGARGIFFNFSQWTSAHGIPHIGRSKHTCLVVFWAIITLGALGLLTWQVVMLVIRYLKYDVSVGMELRFERRGFPAVSVCDLNPYMDQSLEGYPEVQMLLDTYAYALEKSSCNGACVNTASEAKLHQFGLGNITDTVALHSKARDLLVMVMSGISEGIRKEMAPSRRSLIHSCSFNTRDCEMDVDFKEVVDAKMGRCFTFNHNNNPIKYTTSRAGPLYGLRMILFSNTSQYISLTETAGVRVIIHNQTEQPFPDTYGYNVEIGSSTSMGVSFKQIRRLGSPYGKCVDTETLLSGDSKIQYLYNGSYTSEGCQRSCFQDMVQTRCQCSDPNYPQTDESSFVFCSATSAAQRECWYDLVSSHSDKKDGGEAKMSCDQCQLPCEEGVFDVTVSAASWPAKSTLKIAECNDDDDIFTPSVSNNFTPPFTDCLDLYRKNGAMIEVFYEQLNYQLLDESPAYEFVNLASDFGGQIGLWLGLSALSIIEFFVLLGQLCHYCCGSAKAKGGKGGARPPPPQNRSPSVPSRIQPSPVQEFKG